MRRWFTGLLLALFCGYSGLTWSDQPEPESDASLLRPIVSLKTEFRNHIDVVDPTPQNNPKGAEAPGFRGPEQLVLYTPAFGTSTKTNSYGVEVIVDQGRILRLNSSNSPIPPQGFVISGHGTAGQWLKRIIKPGAQASYDSASQQIVIKLTPDVYLSTVEESLDRAVQSARASEDSKTQNILEAAKQCHQQMQDLAQSGGVTRELVDLSETCQKKADEAYFQSLPSYPDKFRGVWVRPVERSPEEVARAIAKLKAANINEIFLETYYQGRTVYPSQVMADYGLPNQHFQFEGWDPLAAWAQAAKQNNMKVHVWVQTFFAGSKHTSIEASGPILQKYPGWANVQRSHVSAAQPSPSSIEDGHYFLDPANPEVRTFLGKLIMEMVTRYAVDGLNLDYIRYPAIHPVTNKDFIMSTWGYSPTARQAFVAMLKKEQEEAETKRIEELKKAGKPIPSVSKPTADTKASAPKWDPIDLTTTDPLWTRWVEWRKEQVSSFVKEIAEKVHAEKPNIFISAVVFPKKDPLLEWKLQDWPRWVNVGWVQALTPIGLGETSEQVLAESRKLREMTSGKAPVYAGIFGMYNRDTPVEFLSQINAAYTAGLAGVVLFERSRLNEDYAKALQEGSFRD